jgi:hypothetical protein
MKELVITIKKQQPLTGSFKKCEAQFFIED